MDINTEKNPQLLAWLEHFVKDIYKQADEIEGIAIATIQNNSINTAYYNMTHGDKILAGGFITQDATMDAVKDLIEDIFYNAE